MTPFSLKVRELVTAIPSGCVATYGQIAAMAGNPRAVRGVVWILHSSSGKYDLPWHRVINRQGKISLPPGDGFEEQRLRLESEGVEFSSQCVVDLDRFLWSPESEV